jgi:hypothetical protein
MPTHFNTNNNNKMADLLLNRDPFDYNENKSYNEGIY